MVEDDSPLKEPLDLPEDTTHSTAPAKIHNPKPKKKTGKVVVVIIVLLVLGATGFGAWKLMQSRSSSSSSTPNPQTSQSKAETKSALPKASGTKKYTNDIMRLTLTYPNNWTVTEENGSTFIQSPDFSYTTNKGDVMGNFRIYIHQSATTSDSKAFGQGLAVLPSEKLTYTNPAPSQRKETYLSFFGLNNTENFDYLLIAGNFNLKKGDSLGPNYGKEADTIIIGGGYSTKDQKEGLTNNQVPTDSFQSTDAYKQAIDILKSIQIN